MATFAAINTAPAAISEPSILHEHTPTTPRPAHDALHRPTLDDQAARTTTPRTPTRKDFNGIPGQRPLPTEPLAPITSQQSTSTVRPSTAPTPDTSRTGAEHSHRDSSTSYNHTRATTPASIQRNDSYQSSTHSTHADDAQIQDVEMEDADDEAIANDDDVSDNDSVTSESQQPSKKKKGQRFFCKDFPPCQLSFTRGEHLARHIRKHTGERPFQCHCSRRFSRLDNLRQHAQTVHVNEDIPGNSPAATSTRFQRQIRTDRVRPPSSRSRASTLGSQGGHSRGHSRNLSTSSITSIASTASSLGGPVEDARRRPPPLAMAGDGSARARLSLETFANANQDPSQRYAYYHPATNGYSTPTSTAFPVEHGSPSFASAMTSPVSAVSRAAVYQGAGNAAPPHHPTHARRLSVPSGSHPFPPPSFPHGQVYIGAPPPFPSQAPSYSPSASSFASPTSSVYSHSRRESETDYDIRRRTWHPSTNTSAYTQRPATSGLTFHSTPDEPRPAFPQHHSAAATQPFSATTRLPGIESFDHAPPPNLRPQSHGMLSADPATKPRPLSSGRPSDGGLHQGLTRLELTSASSAEGPWPAHTRNAPPLPHGHGYFPPNAPPTSSYAPHPHHMSMPEPPVTPRNTKRNAWYGGPIPTQQQPISHDPPPLPPPTTTATAFPASANANAHPNPHLRRSPEDSASSDGIPTTPSHLHAAESHPVILTPSSSHVDASYSHHNHHHHSSAMLVDEHPSTSSQPHSHTQHPQHHYSSPPSSYSHPHPHPHSHQPSLHPPPLNPNPQTYALRSGVGPPPFSSPPHRPAAADLSKLEALVAVATSEGQRG